MIYPSTPTCSLLFVFEPFSFLFIAEPFYHSWALYNFSLVDWNMLPQQILRLISMFLVVAFSSSLDVAAIEMEMGLPLDYNRELNTVGLANIFSGLTGGYTGSYIFSQTIFTMRRGFIRGLTAIPWCFAKRCSF